MRHLLLRLAKMGKTLIVTSHILPELSRICDMVAIITHGRLRAFGTLDQIMRDVAQRRTIEVQLLSEATIEQAAAMIRQRIGDSADVEVSEAEATVRFSTDSDEQTLSTLLGELASQNVGVSQFRELVRDLEDAFLSVTGDRPVHDSGRQASGDE